MPEDKRRARATVDALGKLHEALARRLTELIESDEVTASVLKEAREFLKDNDISALPEGNEGLRNLARVVPFDTGIDAA